MKTPALFHKRLVIVAGKGGVGKSTVAAALALAAARAGKRVLVAEIHGSERMSHFFETRPVGSEVTQIRENLHAVNVQPKDAMREYALMKLPVRFLYGMVFENRLVARFLEAMPGLNEMVMLGKVWWHVVEDRERRTGRPRWDLVVVDAPATGHNYFFLEFPRVAIDAIRTGPIADYARKVDALLTDPKQTSLEIVTLPEEMPVREAIDLRKQMDGLDIPIGHVIVNQVQSPLFNKREHQDFRLLRSLTNSRYPELLPLFKAARAQIERWRNQQVHQTEIRRSLHLPEVNLPFVYDREFRTKAIDYLSRKLADQLERDR